MGLIKNFKVGNKVKFVNDYIIPEFDTEITKVSMLGNKIYVKADPEDIGYDYCIEGSKIGLQPNTYHVQGNISNIQPL